MPPAALDERLIDPTEPRLIEALVRATRTANGRKRKDRVDKDEAAWKRWVGRNRRTPNGHQHWCVSRNGGLDLPLVRAAWWTDRIGRKHWRVQGRRSEYRWWSQYHEGHGPFDQHPLWHVYPERLALRQQRGKDGGARDELVAVCGCGVIGAPDAISWAGTCCGPCQDRREEGLPPLGGGQGFPVHLTGLHTTAHALQTAFTPDRRRLVSGGDDGKVVLWDLQTGAGEVILSRSRSRVCFVAISAEGVVAVGLGRSILMRHLDGRGQKWQAVVGLPNYSTLPRPCFSPDGRWLVIFRNGAVAHLIDTDSALAGDGGAPRPLIQCRDCMGAGFSADGKSLFYFAGAGSLARVELATGAVSQMAQGGDSSQQGQGGQASLAVVEYDEDGAFFDDFDDEISFDFLGHDFDDESGLACSPDGRWLAVSTWWGEFAGLHVCDIRERRWFELLSPEGSKCPANQMAFSPDGRSLVTAHGDGGVRVWSLEKGELHTTLRVTSPGPYGAALAPGGAYLALPAEGGDLRVWPLEPLLSAGG